MTERAALSSARLAMWPPEPADLGAYRAFYAASDVTVGGDRGGRSAAEAEAMHARDMAHWAAIAWASGAPGEPCVETHMRDENAPARRLAARLGGVVDRRVTFAVGGTRGIVALPRESAA